MTYCLPAGKVSSIFVVSLIALTKQHHSSSSTSLMTQEICTLPRMLLDTNAGSRDTSEEKALSPNLCGTIKIRKINHLK